MLVLFLIQAQKLKPPRQSEFTLSMKVTDTLNEEGCSGHLSTIPSMEALEILTKAAMPVQDYDQLHELRNLRWKQLLALKPQLLVVACSVLLSAVQEVAIFFFCISISLAVAPSNSAQVCLSFTVLR